MERTKMQALMKWAKKIINEPMEDGRFPKFHIFHVMHPTEPEYNITVTFASKQNECASTGSIAFDYGFSVRSFEDQYCKAHGKAVAKSRLIEVRSAANVESLRLQDSEELGTMLPKAFSNRVSKGDLQEKFPKDISWLIKFGNWYQIQPPKKDEPVAAGNLTIHKPIPVNDNEQFN